MRHQFHLSLLCLSLLAGCAVPSENGQNPFDEPHTKRSGHPPSSPATLRPIAIERTLPAAAKASEPSALIDISADRVAISEAAPEMPRWRLEDQIPLSQSPNLSSASEAMIEAQRVGETGDHESMIELMKQSAFMGNPDALYSLARIYQNGDGANKDLNLANAYLTTADGLGHAEATRVLAWNYLLANGVPRDRGYAVMLFEKAASKSLRAKREFGMLLGNQLEPGLNDIEKGKTFLQEAAAAGDTLSEAPLHAVLSGTAPKTEPVLGHEPLLASTVVQHSSGSDFLTGLSNDPESKAESLKVRAFRGDRDAVFEYASGLLLRKMPSADAEFEGFCWMSVANDLGHPMAQTELSLIQGIRSISDRKAPGRMDDCISELHMTIAR